MKAIVRIGNWEFELKQVFARKTEKFGDKFESSAVITITDGTPHIELLINKNDDEFTRQDYRDFKAFLSMLGMNKAKYARFKQGNKKEVEKTS